MRILLLTGLLVLAGCAGTSLSPVREAPAAAFVEKAPMGNKYKVATIEVAKNCRLKVYFYTGIDEVRLGTDKVMGKWNGPCSDGRPDGKGTLLLASSYFSNSDDEEQTHAFKFIGTIQNGVGPIEGTLYQDFYIGGGTLMTDKYMDEVLVKDCEKSSYRKYYGDSYFNVTCLGSKSRTVSIKALGNDGLAWFTSAYPDVVFGDWRQAQADNPIAASINFLAKPEVQTLVGVVKNRTDEKVAQKQLTDAQIRKQAYENRCGDLRNSTYWSKECVTGRDKKMADLHLAEVSAKNKVEVTQVKSANYLAGRKVEMEILASKKQGEDAGPGMQCMAKYQDQFTQANRENRFDHDEWAKRRKTDRQIDYVAICPTVKVQKFTCRADVARAQWDSTDPIPMRCLADSLVAADEKIQQKDSLNFSKGKYEIYSDTFCIEGSAPTKVTLDFSESRDGSVPFFKINTSCIWGAAFNKQSL